MKRLRIAALSIFASLPMVIVMAGIALAASPADASHIGLNLGPINDSFVPSFTGDEGFLGHQTVTKVFYSGSLPRTWAGTPLASLPSDVIPIIAWNTATTNVLSFAKSIPAGRRVGFDYQSEPEGAYAGAAAAARFVRQWDSQARLIHSAGNKGLFTILSSEVYDYQRSVNRTALTGAYLPPRKYVNYYGADVYQHQSQRGAWPSAGLANYRPFQAWLKLVHSKISATAHIAITEYGVDATVSNSLRNTRIKQDAAYLRKLHPFCWIYWYHNMGSPSTDYKFSDAPTKATWRAISAGTR